MKNIVRMMSLFLLSPAIHAQVLQISSGTSFVVNGQPSLVLNNMGLQNNGSFIAGQGIVLFTGGLTSSEISGSSAIKFYDLTINKPTSTVQLNASITLDDILRMTKGDILLNGNNIDFDPAATGIKD